MVAKGVAVVNAAVNCSGGSYSKDNENTMATLTKLLQKTEKMENNNINCTVMRLHEH